MTLEIAFFYMIWTNGRTASKIDIPECITQLLVSYSRALLLISIQKLAAFPWLTSFAGLKLGFPLFTIMRATDNNVLQITPQPKHDIRL